MKTFFAFLAVLLAISVYKVYWTPLPSEESVAVAKAKVSQERIDQMRRQADSGDRMAQYELGLLYARGTAALKQDFGQAHDLLQKAAMQGVPQAMYHLGEMYVHGDGVKENFEEATVWFWLATSLGDKYSEKRLRAVNTRISVEALSRAQVRVEKLWKEIPHDLRSEKKSLH